MLSKRHRRGSILKNPVFIGPRRVGHGQRAFIVAELSANHLGSYRRAAALVRAARRAGADAVKLQTYTPDTITLNSTLAHFRVRGTIWKGRRLYDLYREAATPWAWHRPLRDLARSLGLLFFSTPFDATAVRFLRQLRVPAYKIASFEVVDLPLLRAVAGTGKPVIMSCGMATRAELTEAVDTLQAARCRQLILLKCTSAYPAPIDEMNLRTISDMATRFRCPVGLSDHTLGETVPVAAVSLGACMIEKHLTLSRLDGGPDARFSLEPDEFESMVRAVRQAESALGNVRYGTGSGEKNCRRLRKSIFVTQDMARGERFGPVNTAVLRPADGLHPRYLDTIRGKKASRRIRRGQPLCWRMVRGVRAPAE